MVDNDRKDRDEKIGTSQPQIRINLFGGFEVLADGKPVLEQLRHSRKADLFLEFLILKRGRPVPHAELLEALWSDRESRNPATALRTLLHRYRRLVQSEGIAELENSVITARGSYKWNTSLDCVVDVYEFERLALEARWAPAGDGARIPLYQQMMELYRAPPLKAAAEQNWIVPKGVYYHDLYTECVYSLIDLYKARGAHEEIVLVCQRAMEVARFDERLQLEQMMAQSLSGSWGSESLRYRAGSGTWRKQTANTEAFRSTYDAVLHAESSANTDLEQLQQSLDRVGSGAFTCDYSVFEGIYQLQRRLAERSAVTVFLCLLVVNCADKREGLLETQMHWLWESACANLRRGDIVSRHNASQLVALLPASNYEEGRLIVENIKRTFFQHAEQNVMVTYRLRPLLV